MSATVTLPAAKAGDLVRVGRCRCGVPIFASVGDGPDYDMAPGAPVAPEREDLTCAGCREKSDGNP